MEHSPLSVAIYRARSLPFSETFILDHLRQLNDIDARIVCLKPVVGLDIDADRFFAAYPRTMGRLGMLRAKAHARTTPLNAYLANWRPSLIHAHFATDGVDVMSIADQLNIPLIVTLHGIDVTRTTSSLVLSGPERWLFLLRRKSLFRRAKFFLAVSEYIKQQAIERGVPKEKIYVHYIGIDISQIGDFPTDVAERGGVLFVGRLVEKKRLADVISALALLKDRRVDIPLTVIGDGPLRDRLEEQAISSGVSVRFLGQLPRERVIEEMKRARLFCMPSAPARSGDNEGLPVVFMEAQACGTPVVSYNQGPIPEAVVHEKTGLLCEVGDIRSLADNIHRLHDDFSLQSALSLNARRHVEKEFNLADRRAALLDFYRSAIL